MLASEAFVNMRKIQSGFISRDDQDALINAAAKLTESHIYIDDTPGISLAEMRAKARRLIDRKLNVANSKPTPSRTNSPAWVEADFPSRLSRRTRSMVCFFGMIGTQKMLSADRSRKMLLRHIEDSLTFRQAKAGAPNPQTLIRRTSQARPPLIRATRARGSVPVKLPAIQSRF